MVQAQKNGVHSETRIIFCESSLLIITPAEMPLSIKQIVIFEVFSLDMVIN